MISQTTALEKQRLVFASAAVVVAIFCAPFLPLPWYLHSLATCLGVIIAPGVGWTMHRGAGAAALVPMAFASLAIHLVVYFAFAVAGSAAPAYPWVAVGVVSVTGLLRPGFREWLNEFDGEGSSYHSAVVGLFLATFFGYLYTAVCVVPPLDDHDFEVQGTVYSLMKTAQPRLLTDRGGTYFFAHPPLWHFCVGLSLFHEGKLPEVAVYDEVTDRFERYEATGIVEDPTIQFADKADFLQWFSPSQRLQLLKQDPLAVQLTEYDGMIRHFHFRPYLRETRQLACGFAALTVTMMYSWLWRRTENGTVSLLSTLCYAVGPEVVVRSSYGGYFSISNFCVMAMLAFATGTGNQPFTAASNGVFPIWANHKLILLSVASSVTLIIRRQADSRNSDLAGLSGHWLSAVFLLRLGHRSAAVLAGPHSPSRRGSNFARQPTWL